MDPFIQNLKEKLTQPLPGRNAQLKMAHVTRRQYVIAPDNARQAAVMATLFPKNEEWHVVLIERNANDRDHHGGQISFPGGKVEPADTSLLHTALRETEEEVGIAQQKVNVLGGLSELYIPVSNFQVHPFIGFLDHQPAYTIQEEEVHQVIEVPLSHFQNPATLQIKDVRINKHLSLKNVPYFDVKGKVLWGATAMMMSELMAVIGSEKLATISF